MDNETVLMKLRKRKVFTIDQLISFLNGSMRTARRRILQWKVFTSINQNGRYYTLPDIPQFNSNGLWRYRNVLFSQHGNLKQTTIHLIRQSPHGLTAQELMELLDHPTPTFLTPLRESSDLRREKHHGRYIYFAGDAKIYAQQKRRWEALEEEINAQLSDEESVQVLVYFIKHPQLTPEELARRLSCKGRSLKAVGIRRLLETHDLQKKTPGIKP